MQNQKLVVAGLCIVVVIGVIAVSLSKQSEPMEGTLEIASATDTATRDEVMASIMAVTGEDVAYFPESNGFYARPDTPGVYPGIVMIHENRGLREEIKEAARELAAKGYHVLAVDLYKGTVMETQEEARAYSSQYDKALGVTNMQAAADFLRSEGATKLASLGWCFGGAESLALSTSGEELDATVIYYGRLTDDPAVLSKITSPVLGIFGDADQVVATTSVLAFEATLKELGVSAEIHMYEGVGHAFANPSNPNFAPLETEDAWVKTLAFLEANLR
jgi:carboxymethylenebutenolidase